MTIRFACENDIPQMLDLLLQVGEVPYSRPQINYGVI